MDTHNGNANHGAPKKNPAAASNPLAKPMPDAAPLGPPNNFGGQGEPPAATSPPEDLQLERFRLSQDFAAAVGVKKRLVTVPVRRPTRQEFVRVHPNSAWRFTSGLLHLREEREVYLVAPELCGSLVGEVVPSTVYTAINRQGVTFLWPVRLPGPDGRIDEWSRSAHEGAALAKEAWVKIASNMALGAYEILEAQGDLSEPDWPDVDFAKLVNIGFKGKVIEDTEHPVLRRLRGEV